MADEIKTTIEIVANLAQVQSQLKTLENDFKSSFGKIQALGKDLLGTLGVGLSVGGGIALIEKLGELGQRLEDIHVKTGIATQTLSGLKTVVEQEGSTIEDFGTGVTKASRSLVDSGAAGDKARASLLRLGFTQADITKSTANSEFFLDKFSKVLAEQPNHAERARVAFDVLQRAGANLIPTFLKIAETAGGLDAIKKNGIDPDTIANLNKLNDAIIALKNNILNFSARPLVEAINTIRFALGTPITELTSPEDQLHDLDKKIEELQKRLSGPQGPLVKPLQNLGLIATPEDLEKLKQQRETLQNIIDLKKPESETPTTPTSDKATQDATKAAENFRESIEKEIIKLREQSIALFDGADAAKAFALGEDLALAKQKTLQNLLAAKIPQPIAEDAISKAFANIDVALLTARLKAAREQIIGFAQVLIENPADFKKWLDTKELDDLVVKTTSALERVRKAFAEPPTGNLATLTLTAIDKELQNAQEEAQRFASIFGLEFNKAEQDANDLRATIDKLVKDLRLGGDNPIVIKRKIEFENTQLDAVNTALVRAQDEAKTLGEIFGVEFNAAQQEADALRTTIERLVRERKLGANDPEVIKLKVDFDEKQVDAAVTDLTAKIQAAQERARLSPPLQTNVAADTAQARQAEIDRLLNNQSAGARAERERQAGLLAGDRVNAILTDLDNKQKIAAAEAQALGTALDLPRENAAILTEEIKRLIAEGFDPLGPQIQNLKQQLDEAKFGDIIVHGFENAFDILDQLIDGQIKSWRDLGKSIEKVFADVAKEILKTNLKEQLPNLLNQFGIKLPGSTINVPGGTQPGGASTGPLTAPSAIPLQANTTATAANTNALIALTQALSASGGLQQIPRGGSIPGTGQSPQGAVLPPEPVIRETDITGQKSTLGAAIEAQVTEAQTTIDNLGDVASVAIEAKRDLAGGSIVGLTADALKAIEGESRAGLSALDALKTIAINAITAMGSSGGGGGGGLLGGLGGGGGNPLSGILGMFGGGGGGAALGSAGIGQGATVAAAGGLAEGTTFTVASTSETLFPLLLAAFHTGGIVGETAPASRYIHVPFDVPRYHSGLAPDERMGILQVGEAVISRDQVKKARMNSGGGITINVNNPNFADRTSASQTLQQMGRTVNNAFRRHS